MYEALNQMNSLHYTINSIDSFMSGNVQVQQGEVMLMRNRGNDSFPFKIYGKDSEGNELIFDGQRVLHVYHNKKEFEFDVTPDYRSILGDPGGQLVLSEFLFKEQPFNPETAIGYNKLEVQEFPDRYILTLRYPQNVMFGIRDRTKILTLDKKTWMPVSYHHTINGFDGERQVNICKITNIKLNDSAALFPSINTSAFTSYIETFTRTESKPTYTGLLNSRFIDMELKDIHGSVAKLSDKKDKVILLVFWEIWCGPCIESIPKIKTLSSKYSAELFEVWGIASDPKTFPKVPATVKRLGITYPVYYGTEQTKKDYQVTGVPEYVIIDRSGKIVFIDAGFSEGIEKKLDELLR